MRFSENAWGKLKMCADITELDKEGMLLYIRDGNIDEADLLELVTNNDFDIALAVANCKCSTEPILDIAAHDRDDRIRLAVVNNDNCGVRTLQYLEKDSNHEIASVATGRLKGGKQSK